MKKLFSGKSFGPISRQSILILLIGTIVLLLQLGYIAFDILYGTHENDLYMIGLYRKCLDYILLEIVILVVGAFLFDMTVREAVGIE